MHFTPKQSLKETAAANPLDKAVAENQDITDLAQEAILTAVAAETDAINQYQQVLELVDKSEEWLVEKTKTTLEDIISEEKKHFAQLANIVSKLPAFEKEFEAGTDEAETGKDTDTKAESSLTEGGLSGAIDQLKDIADKIGATPAKIEKTIYINDAVDPETGIVYWAIYTDPKTCMDNINGEPVAYIDKDDLEQYKLEHNIDKVIHRDELPKNESVYDKTPTYLEFDADKVIKILSEELNMSVQELNNIADERDFIFDKVSDKDIDKFLDSFELDPQLLDKIENRIINEALWTRDEEEAKQKEIEDQEDFEHDISELESLLNAEQFESVTLLLYSDKVKRALSDFIYNLKHS